MLCAKHRRHPCKGSATSVLHKITPECVLLPHSRDLGTASMGDGPALSSAPGKALFLSEGLGKPSKLCHQELGAAPTSSLGFTCIFPWLPQPPLQQGSPAVSPLGHDHKPAAPQPQCSLQGTGRAGSKHYWGMPCIRQHRPCSSSSCPDPSHHLWQSPSTDASTTLQPTDSDRFCQRGIFPTETMGTMAVLGGQ